MSKRTAIAALFAATIVTLLIGIRFSHRARNHSGNSTRPEIEEAPAALVLPAVSPQWTNIGTQPPVRPAPTLALTQRVRVQLPTNPVAAADNTPSLNSLRVQARAKELLARAALDNVGVDPEADRAWVAAISDENLGADERRSLILALDQAGLPDWSRAGAQDLPMIASRIALVEEITPNALDVNNATALQQVHTSLLDIFEAASADLGTSQSGTSEQP